jgi:hypothetical protein
VVVGEHNANRRRRRLLVLACLHLGHRLERYRVGPAAARSRGRVEVRGLMQQDVVARA